MSSRHRWSTDPVFQAVPLNFVRDSLSVAPSAATATTAATSAAASGHVSSRTLGGRGSAVAVGVERLAVVTAIVTSTVVTSVVSSTDNQLAIPIRASVTIVNSYDATGQTHQ
jgi:hypothetical protein